MTLATVCLEYVQYFIAQERFTYLSLARPSFLESVKEKKMEVRCTDMHGGGRWTAQKSAKERDPRDDLPRKMHRIFVSPPSQPCTTSIPLLNHQEENNTIFTKPNKASSLACCLLRRRPTEFHHNKSPGLTVAIKQLNLMISTITICKTRGKKGN